MESKIKIKLGPIEVEYEGSESFLKQELPALIKTVTELFKAILEMRKEITKSIKDEIEIRRKISDFGENGDLGEIKDIRGLAKEVEKLRALDEKTLDNLKKQGVAA